MKAARPLCRSGRLRYAAAGFNPNRSLLSHDLQEFLVPSVTKYRASALQILQFSALAWILLKLAGSQQNNVGDYTRRMVSNVPPSSATDHQLLWLKHPSAKYMNIKITFNADISV
jgi:hypothetical protein